MADASLAHVNFPPPGRQSKEELWKTVSREFYGKLRPQTVYYEFTGDPAFLKNGTQRRPDGRPARQPDGTFPNLTFWGYLYTGLGSIHRLTGNEGIRDALIGLVKPFREFPKDPLNAPRWGRDTMEPFAFAAAVPGDARFLHYPIRRLQDHFRLTQLDGTPGWMSGLGFASMERVPMPAFMEGRSTAWASGRMAASRSFPGRWPTGQVYFAARLQKEGPFNTALTCIARKEAGKAGTIVLAFRDPVFSFDSFENKRLDVRVTRPDGKVSVMPLKSTTVDWYGKTYIKQPVPPRIALAAEDPAGEYRIEVVSEQMLFWINPKTDLPGLVVWQPGSRLGMVVGDEPSHVYSRLKPGTEQLSLEIAGSARPDEAFRRPGRNRPATVLLPPKRPRQSHHPDPGRRARQAVCHPERIPFFLDGRAGGRGRHPARRRRVLCGGARAVVPAGDKGKIDAVQRPIPVRRIVSQESYGVFGADDRGPEPVDFPLAPARLLPCPEKEIPINRPRNMDLPSANHGSIEEGCGHASSPSEAAARFDGPVTFSVHYDLVPFDYWAAQLFAHREATARRTSPVRRVFVGLVYLAVAVGSVWLARRWGISLLVVYLSLAALLCGWLWWTLPRRTAPVAAELLGHRELVVLPVGITVTGESQTASWPWQAIQRTTISETHLLIFDQQKLLCLVPKRAFVDTEQFCRFSAELDRRIMAAAGQVSSVTPPTTPFATATGEQDSATARTPVLTVGRTPSFRTSAGRGPPEAEHSAFEWTALHDERGPVPRP